MADDPEVKNLSGVRLVKFEYQAKIRSANGTSVHRMDWEKIEKATQLLYDYRWRYQIKKKRGGNHGT